jgi:hypothetical protein
VAAAGRLKRRRRVSTFVREQPARAGCGRAYLGRGSADEDAKSTRTVASSRLSLLSQRRLAASEEHAAGRVAVGGWPRPRARTFDFFDFHFLAQ